MEIAANLDKVANPHEMGSPCHNEPQFLHARDVGLGQSLALDLELGDSSGENVPLEPWDDLLVDVLDGDERVRVSRYDVEEEVTPAKCVEVETVHRLTVTCTNNGRCVQTCLLCFHKKHGIYTVNMYIICICT